MKSLFAAAFSAMLLSGAVAAHAATAGSPANQGVQLAETQSTPFTYGNGNAQALPVFNYQDPVPVTATVASGRVNSIALQNGVASLVGQPSGN